MSFQQSADLSINCLRALCADIVQNANSGHPGAPMGLSPAAFVLFNQILRYNPMNPEWSNRDRFLLSNGHACALLYASLHLTGYPEWTLDVLKTFRKLDSMASGHPEIYYPGIEVTTGPLGQGIANAVGLALAERHLAATFNRPGFDIVDNYTFVICGDGCIHEGISSEASSLAGHLGLGKLILIYDDNHITIDGETSLALSEDVLGRYHSYGWHTQIIKDGDHDIEGFAEAIRIAKNTTDKPSIIQLTTTIGFGSSKENTEAVHGAPLGAEDLSQFKVKFGLDPNLSFHIPPSVYEEWSHVEQGEADERCWNDLFAQYASTYPELAAEFKRRQSNQLLPNWEQVLPTHYKPGDPAMATRRASGNCLNALANFLPEIMGGSADLNPSTFTYLTKFSAFQKRTPEGRNIHFGIREHCMASIMNGMSAYGLLIPFGSTFLNFLGYCLGAVTLSAISHAQVIYIFTHDSIGLGEDGPTHQPIEKFMLCRNLPNLLFIRPADALETSAAYIAALRNRHGPTMLALSRQNLPHLSGSSIEGVLHGAYSLNVVPIPALIIVATGSEVELAVNAAAELNNVDHLEVRVVSFPSWELFDIQTQAYKEEVFTPGVPVLSIEASTTLGWERYAHASLGINSFGASAPASALFKKFGFTVENAVTKARLLIHFYATRQVPSLVQRPF